MAQIFPDLPLWPEAESSYDYSGWDLDRTAQWLRWMVLLKVDRASMNHSLEVRVPLLDREVIEVAAQVDWQSCLDLDAGLGKLPLRRALARHLDYQITSKRGFGVPMEAWLSGALRPAMEGLLLSRDELLGLPLNRKALRSLFSENLSGNRDYGWGLWPLLSLALWERHHLHGRQRADRLAS